MFSFHKPKTYRSAEGCCICKAKSSSSRFTCSTKYENDFADCFRIDERRAGEICNACVLLVKRWKKLPSDSKRHWHHVVDARAGPGSKSISKVKSKLNQNDEINHFTKYKHKKLPSKHAPSRLFARSSSIVSDDNLIVSDEDSSSSESYDDLNTHKKCKKEKSVSVSPLLDLTYWKKTTVCCGIVFVGEFGETIVDPKLIRGCEKCVPNYSSLSDCSKEPMERQTSSGSTIESDQEELDERSLDGL